MKCIINDTNIWIDLKTADIMEKIFNLPYKIVCPDILFYDELINNEGDLLLSFGIEILELNNMEMQEVENFSNENRSISFNDTTAFILAKNRKYTLVTGDKALRKIAGRNNVEYKETIQLIDELVNKKIISFSDGITCCKKLLNYSRRLPKSELEKRINNWSN